VAPAAGELTVVTRRRLLLAEGREELDEGGPALGVLGAAQVEQLDPPPAPLVGVEVEQLVEGCRGPAGAAG